MTTHSVHVNRPHTFHDESSIDDGDNDNDESSA